MERHQENSLAIAKYLSHHPAIEKVIHPLLHNHPNHHLAIHQNLGKHSGIMALYIKVK